MVSGAFLIYYLLNFICRGKKIWAMDSKEARRILNVSEYDDINEIKRKYRRLMGRFHPDVLGSEKPEYIRKAQEINEAYRTLKKSGDKLFGAAYKSREPEWKAELNEKAFCARNIYLYYSMETETDKLFYRTARGKYMWNPDEEDFRLFITSLYHASKELLEKTEENNYQRGREEKLTGKTEKFEFQARLVHCLVQQFTDPVKILRKISNPERTDSQGRAVYHFTAMLKIEKPFIGGMEKRRLKAGSALYPKGFRENRIAVCDQNGEPLGYLSFSEDELYLCVIPLLKSKKAQLKMSVGKENNAQKPDNTRVKVDFYLRLEDTVEGYQNPDQNLRIAEILREYEEQA